MDRYTREKLQEMARECLRAKTRHDARYLRLVLILAHACNMSWDEVEEMIWKLAGDDAS